ncbi:hypothetical protein ACO2Q7_01445 [Rathayibacter sp. KR2-224]|uniref:PH-like domain-containing protein n=1 Tax=Rathayibacter sp. KR2-224 TaxID=3400913 RepID=UPI003C05CDFA
MDKFWPTVLIIVILALVFVGMWWGWRRRARRDSGLVVPSVLRAPGETILTTQAVHVATTHHERPLDRVVVPGLAFRANATVTVSTGGVTLTAPGETSVAISACAILGAGTATWTIDRSVERDGLVLVAWHTEAAAGGTDPAAAALDTYLRLADAAEQGRLVAAIRSMTQAPNDTTGADDVATDTTTGSEA